MPKQSAQPAQPAAQPATPTSDIARLLSEQSERIQENTRIIKKMARRLLLWQIMGWVKVLVILVPVIAGIVYLKPVVQGVMNQYAAATAEFSPLLETLSSFSQGAPGDGDTVTVTVPKKLLENIQF